MQASAVIDGGVSGLSERKLFRQAGMCHCIYFTAPPPISFLKGTFSPRFSLSLARALQRGVFVFWLYSLEAVFCQVLLCFDLLRIEALPLIRAQCPFHRLVVMSTDTPWEKNIM